MQEFVSKYFISHIDTGPSILSNGSNSIILSFCLFFLYLFLVFSHKAAATQLLLPCVKHLFLGIFFIEIQQHFLHNSLGNKIERQPP